MDIAYATTKSYPSGPADYIYIKKFAEAFSKAIPGQFTLFINNNRDPEYLKTIDKVITLSLGKRFRSLKFFFRFPSLYRQLNNNQKDIIWISNDLYILASLQIYKLFYKNIYICSDLHIYNNSLLYRLAVLRSDWIICNNSVLKSILNSRLHIHKEKILVSPMGIDLSIFGINLSIIEARKQLDLPINLKIIGYFGRFKTMGMEKGVANILRSLSLLGDNFLFIAAGGYDQDVKFYINLSEKLGVSKNFLCLGDMSQELIATYQKACDMLLMPFPFTKHYANNMSPMKMFEYMASRRPIIASDLPSIRDVLSDNHNALLVTPDNDQALANTIKALVDNKKNADRLAQQAYQDVLDFTWEKKIFSIIQFFSSKKSKI